MKICILPTHANLSLYFPDSNWYISVVLLYTQLNEHLWTEVL